MARIRPTRRGVVLAVLTVGGVAAGATFGPRSLDALVLPAVVALIAAGVQVATLSAPRVRRTTPAPGPPGTTGTMSLALTTDTPVVAAVADRLPSGVAGDGRATALVGGDADPITYEVTFRERGDHAYESVRVRARDVLGLAQRSFVVEAPGSVLVYPTRYRPSTALAERLRALSSPDDAAERGAFDHLREYARGDSLRDVHWKSSAKRNELVVQEFADEGERRTVTVAASAANARADRMAEATATVCTALLAEDVTVSLATPADRFVVEPGEDDRLLAHLARVGPGSVAGRDADVRVEATRDGTTIRVGGETLAFDPTGHGTGATAARTSADGRSPAREVAP